MNKFLDNLKRALVSLVVFVIIVGPFLLLAPGVHSIDISVHGWGWGVLIASFIVLTVARSYLGSFCKGLLSPSENVAKLGENVSDWVIIVLAIFLAAVISPSLVSYTGGIVLLFGAALYGVGFWAGDLVSDRFFGKKSN